MADFGKVLKEEFARVARRTTGASDTAPKKDVATLKHAVADLRKTVSRLTRENARLVADLNSRLRTPVKASEDEMKHPHLSPGLIRSLRRRLGLSQGDFERLVGANGNAVGLWDGSKARPRAATKPALIGARKFGRREAGQRLEALGPAYGNGRSAPPRKKPSKGRTKANRNR